MKDPTITYFPVFPENPGNPARCEVKTGRIEINRQVWDFLPEVQKAYVLEHEKGHYYRQTFDEVVADQYALERLALKKKDSLWNYVLSVRNISHGDPRRVRAAERSVLEIAAKTGSKRANELLRIGYANADGRSDNLLSKLGVDPIEYGFDLRIEWWQFAWILILVVTIILLYIKFN